MEDEQILPEEEEATPAPNGEKAKTPWQIQKESWYDKLNLSVKTLDTIIGVCMFLLVLCFLAICLDAMGIYNFFG